jgi:hypothetical protein
MRRLFVVVLLLTSSLFVQSLKAQYYYYNNRYYDGPVSFEAGGSVGLMNSFTDVGGKKGVGKNFIKDLNWKNTKPSFGIFAMATYKYALGLRLEGTFGSVHAADSQLAKVAASTSGRYERNLSFKSKITDVQLSLEVHPLFFRNYDENEAPRLSPYAVAGIGFFMFEPTAELKGRTYSLQPLRTEGQGFAEYRDRTPYGLTQVNFPLGIGVRYEVNSFLNARLEVVHRVLMTDYLDDVSKDYVNPDLFATYLPSTQAGVAVQLFDRQGELNSGHQTVIGSQRGDPKDNDAYFSVQLKISVSLGRLRR